MHEKEGSLFGLKENKGMTSIVSCTVLAGFGCVCAHDLLILSSVSTALSLKFKTKQIPVWESVREVKKHFETIKKYASTAGS